MKNTASMIAAILILNLMLGLARAEEIELEKIVVTPYRTGVPSEINGSSVEKINAAEAKSEGVNLLKDALVESSSVVSASPGNLGGSSSIFLRGHNSNHTRFMLNGIKIYDPILTTSYYSFSHFDLQGIDKIEISKGPQSSLYGSDAIGGVINLFSKKGEGKPRFTLRQEVGSYNTYIESLELLGEAQKLAYCLGAIRTDIGGYSLAKEKNNNHERDPYHNLNASIRLDYTATDKTKLELLERYIYAKYEYDGTSWTPPYLPTDDNDNYAYDYENITGLTVKQNISDILDYKAVVSSTQIYRKSWEDASSDSWYMGKTYQFDNQFNLRIINQLTTIAGFDYLKEAGDSFRVDSGFVSDFPKETAENRGYFLENIFSPYKDFSLAFSCRRDSHSVFNEEDTYRGVANYNLKEIGTKIKASYGTGFKAPSIYQLYAPATSWGPIGNSNLQPEKSQAYELGAEKEITHNFSMGLNYFQSHLKDLIEFSSTSGYQNINKSSIKGLESIFNYSLNKATSIFLGHTWLDAENKDTHKELARRPANKTTFKIKSEIDRLTLTFGLAYVGHRFSDTAASEKLKPYILGNLSLNYRLKDGLDMFGRLENMFDEKYEEVTGYQTPKFSMYMGLKKEF